MYTEMLEPELVERAIKRDTDAFAELYALNVVSVYRHVYYLVYDSKEAEDLTAQTFLKAWETIDRYQQRGAPFISWLLRIAHNLSVSFLRAKRPHSELSGEFVCPKLHSNPADLAERHVDEQNVRDAVLKLKDEQRRVIMLRFVEELDYRDVAAVMGKSVPMVRVIQHRAICKLRTIMQVT